MVIKEGLSKEETFELVFERLKGARKRKHDVTLICKRQHFQGNRGSRVQRERVEWQRGRKESHPVNSLWIFSFYSKCDKNPSKSSKRSGT